MTDEMKNKIKQNPLITAFIITLFGLLMTWGIWATTSIYAHSEKLKEGVVKSDMANTLRVEINKVITDDICELKQNFLILQGEIKGQGRQIIDNHLETIRSMSEIKGMLKIIDKKEDEKKR